MAASLTGDYQFSSEPRTLKAKIYRDQEESSRNTNIMIDKRVVRGNTFAAMVIPASSQLEVQKRQVKDNQKLTSHQEKQMLSSIDEERQIKTPDPVEGRMNIEVQTELIPEVLTEKPIDVFQEVQTDYYIDRPVSPLFTLKKRGEDQETQVEYDELFDFDFEVQPLLEVLVTKSLEIGRMEVLEEAEFKAMALHNQEFQQKRKIQLNELQRIEGEEIRKKEEIKARRVEAQSRKENFKFTHKKFISRIMAKKFLSQISENAFKDLESLGNYEDLQRKSMVDQINPWILESVVGTLNQRSAVQKFLEGITSEAFYNLKNLYSKAIEHEKNRLENEKKLEAQALKDEEERRKKRVQLRIQKKIDLKLKELKKMIEEKVIMNGNPVEKVFSSSLNDIDSRQVENIIATPGGLFGELLSLLSAVEEILKLTIPQDQMNALLVDFVTHAMKSSVLSYQNVSDSDLKDFLKNLKPNLTIDTIHSAEDDLKSMILNFLLDPSNAIADTSLTIMWKNKAKYGIRDDLFESLIRSFFHVLSLKDIDSTHINLTRAKVSIKAEDLEKRTNLAVVKIFNQSTTEEGFDDRTVAVNPTVDDSSAVFVIHKAAQVIVRNELVYWIKGIKEFESIDVEQLKEKVREMGEMREQKIIARLAKGLPVFEYFV